MTHSERTLRSALVPMIGFALVFFVVLAEHIKGDLNVTQTGELISWGLSLLGVAALLVLKSTIQAKPGE